MDITVTYKLTDDNALVMDYTAVTDAPTIINLTNHTYFNLDGCDGGDVLHQELWLDADRFTEGNAETCPTGRILPVRGTPWTLQSPKPSAGIWTAATSSCAWPAATTTTLC